MQIIICLGQPIITLEGREPLLLNYYEMHVTKDRHTVHIPVKTKSHQPHQAGRYLAGRCRGCGGSMIHWLQVIADNGSDEESEVRTMAPLNKSDG